MLQLTFLKGIKSGYNASKTFVLDGAAVRKVSDYDIGQTFYHNTEVIPLSHPHLRAVLIQRGVNRWFHIYGEPAKDLAQQVRRLKENFPECLTRLLVMDIDKYKLPPDIAAQWTDSTVATTTDIIQQVLKRLKLTPLVGVDFTYVLSSSQMNRSTLSAHLYFFLDKPVTLPDLRRWGRVMNKGYGSRIIDSSIYKSVQPVYISAPVCTNFKDPFPQRIGNCLYGTPLVSVDALKTLGFTMNRQPVPTNIDKGFSSYSKAVESTDKAIKKTWVRTLEAHCGAPSRGINEPSHRAAAQMIQEEGTDIIKADLDGYVKSFHEEMWRAIKKHGVRGDQDDIDKYGIDKARSYVESALDKGFGDQADQLGKLVEKAIDKAVADSSPKPMYVPDIKRALGNLKRKHNARYAEIRVALKTKLRGLISITDYEKQLNVFQLTPSSMPFDPTDLQAVIDYMRSQITMIEDVDGSTYLHWPDKEATLGYQLVSTTSHRLDSFLILFYRNLTKLSASRKTAMQIIDDINYNVSAESGLRSSTSGLVGKRIVESNGAIYYRLGPVNNIDMTVEIDENGVRYQKTEDVKGIYWESNKLKAPPVADRESVIKTFGTDDPPFDDIKKYLLRTLPKFIQCDPQSIDGLMSIATSIIVRKPLIYLGVFEGPASSGKTFGASVFKQLFDPKFDDVQYGKSCVSVLPKRIKGHDFAVFEGSDVTVFDNVRTLTDDHQNTFSQLSTGSSTPQRILYSHKTHDISLRQCVLLTTLYNPVVQADLASRSILIDFPVAQTRLNTQQMIDRFVKESPIIRYCWFRTVSEYLKMLPQLSNNPNVSARDYILACCNAIFTPAKQLTSNLVNRVEQAASDKKFLDIVEKKVIMMFIAFLDQQTADKYTWTADEKWTLFREWARHNNGTTKEATFEIGSKTFVEKVTIDSMELPDTQRSFETVLGSAQANISAVSMWTIKNNTRRQKARRKKFTHKYASIRNIF